MQMRAHTLIRKVLVGFLLPALLLLTALPAAPALAKREVVPARGTLPASLLTDGGALNLATGFSGALDLRGWQVTLDAQRGPLFRPAEDHPSPPASGGDWSRTVRMSGGAMWGLGHEKLSSSERDPTTNSRWRICGIPYSWGESTIGSTW